MKIEDKIYIPHICTECSIARLIPRIDLHGTPKIYCTECGAGMKRWVTHKEAPFEPFSGQSGYYLTWTRKLRETTDTPWQQNSGSSLADVRKKVGQDLVDWPGMPEMVYLPSEYEGAQLRAEHMAEKIEDLIVTLVCDVNPGVLHIEFLRYSQVVGRVHELRQLTESKVKVLIVYSEETKQMFGWNDLVLHEKPRLPRYGQEYDKKRTAYRTPSDGVIQ